MNTERLEEVMLILTGIALLTFTLPFSMPRAIITTVIVALLLMGLLVLRSIAWHRNGITPFDGIMVIGIGVTIAYLASFTAFSQNLLNIIVLLLFAAFYALMAAMLFQHRFGQNVKRARTTRKASPHVSREEFKKGSQEPSSWNRRSRAPHGVEPIPERAPPWEKPSLFKRMFNLDRPSPGWQRPPVAAIPERPPRWYNRTMVQDTPRPHTAAFKHGIEPIPEITPEHLHRMGVYDTEPRKRK